MTNLQPVVDALLPVATIIVGICVPVITVKLTTFLGLKIDSAHQNALDAAIEDAIGKILHLATATAAMGPRVVSVPVSGAAITDAVASVRADAPKAVAHFKLTDADITRKLDARWALRNRGDGGRAGPWN